MINNNNKWKLGKIFFWAKLSDNNKLLIILTLIPRMRRYIFSLSLLQTIIVTEKNNKEVICDQFMII
jgi:hypothetical protein